MNKYITDLIKENINYADLEKYVDFFSRYIGYTNPDYKYNGTYLNQYIKEFEEVTEGLKKKSEVYDQIYIKILDILVKLKLKTEINVEIIIDKSYCAHIHSNPYFSYREYVLMDRTKILKEAIDFSVELTNINGDSYFYCKEYELCDNLPEKIGKEVNRFLSNLNKEGGK